MCEEQRPLRTYKREPILRDVSIQTAVKSLGRTQGHTAPDLFSKCGDDFRRPSDILGTVTGCYYQSDLRYSIGLRIFLLQGHSLLYKKTEFPRGQRSPFFQGGKTNEKMNHFWRKRHRKWLQVCSFPWPKLRNKTTSLLLNPARSRPQPAHATPSFP